MSYVDRAMLWFAQAESDLRTAEVLLAAPPPLKAGDVGCHAAAMCAQAVEKGIKGYVILNHATPSMDHRPDKYLVDLLTKDDPLLRYTHHHKHISKLFNPETKAAVGELLDLTPGGQGNRDDVPNTEYPWKEGGEWRHTPYAALSFTNPETLREWYAVARRVLDTFRKLAIAVRKGEKL